MQPEVQSGFVPGLIGAVVALHGEYYAKHHGFGPEFEAVVAGGLADFAPRLKHPCNQFWHASLDRRIIASIAIDGEDLGGNVGHLRWFIVSEAARGHGLGRLLLKKAIAFCDEQSFAETHLWTFKGLDAARKLYENFGFVLAEEYEGDQWGTVVIEQKFVRLAPV